MVHPEPRSSRCTFPGRRCSVPARLWVLRDCPGASTFTGCSVGGGSCTPRGWGLVSHVSSGHLGGVCGYNMRAWCSGVLPMRHAGGQVGRSLFVARVGALGLLRLARCRWPLLSFPQLLHCARYRIHVRSTPGHTNRGFYGTSDSPSVLLDGIGSTHVRLRSPLAAFRSCPSFLKHLGRNVDIQRVAASCRCCMLFLPARPPGTRVHLCILARRRSGVWAY